MENAQVKTPISSYFPLLQQLLRDSFHVDSLLHSYPYTDLSKIDRGFRKMIWDKYSHPMPPPLMPNSSSIGYRMFVVKSFLGFYNIIAFISLQEHPDFISIGPFRTEELSPNSYSKLFKKDNLSKDYMSMVQQFYRVLPLADLNDVISMTQHLISFFLPDFSEVSPETMNYSDNGPEPAATEETQEIYTQSYAESYAEYLSRFLQSLVSGHPLAVSDALREWMQFLGISAATTLGDLRKFLYDLNSHCQGKLLTASIHPLYVLRLFYSYDMTISTCVNKQKLILLAQELSRKYCLLVKNYGFVNYSYLIRNVVNYIDGHLEEELTLSVLSGEFQRNASSLSAAFSKETGYSITDWIHTQRIKKALQYFNTTELSVAEVASKVGICDLSYFSKLFKKQVGQAPSYYRKMMRRSKT